jgi:hypothetical protein
MRLIRVNEYSPQQSLYCVSCQSYKPVRLVWADLDGAPFSSYHCELCVQNDPAMSSSVEYSTYLKEDKLGSRS